MRPENVVQRVVQKEGPTGIAPWLMRRAEREVPESGESNGKLAKRLGVPTDVVRDIRDRDAWREWRERQANND